MDWGHWISVFAEQRLLNAWRGSRTEILQKYRSVLCTVHWMIEKYILTLKGMGFIATEDLEKDTSMLQLYLRNANEIRLLKTGYC